MSKDEYILLAAADAAVTWWRGKKPVNMSIAEHLKTPTVNCQTYREKSLARKAARWFLVTHPRYKEDV
jgi:hypothetical protein